MKISLSGRLLLVSSKGINGGHKHKSKCLKQFYECTFLGRNVLYTHLVPSPSQAGLQIGQRIFSIHFCPLPIFQPRSTTFSSTSSRPWWSLTSSLVVFPFSFFPQDPVVVIVIVNTEIYIASSAARYF